MSANWAIVKPIERVMNKLLDAMCDLCTEQGKNSHCNQSIWNWNGIQSNFGIDFVPLSAIKILLFGGSVFSLYFISCNFNWINRSLIYSTQKSMELGIDALAIVYAPNVCFCIRNPSWITKQYVIRLENIGFFVFCFICLSCVLFFGLW